MDAISNVVHDTLKKVVPPMVDKTTNDNVKKNLPKVVAEAIRLEREKVKDDISAIVAKAMKDDEQAKCDDLPGWLSLMYMFGRPTAHVEPYRVAVVRTPDHKDHHDDDARPKGESIAKRQKTPEHGTYTTGESYKQWMN
ncbi:hypothetical protein Tco_0677165 [Tanacetum coccineum]